MCTVLRIDERTPALNYDTATGVQSVSRPIYDPDRQKIYFAWSSATHTSVSIQHNYQVFFRSLDVATNTWDSDAIPVSVENPDVALGVGVCDCVSMERLSSTGELIIFYGDIVDTYCHMSTDNGATWSSPRTRVTTPALSFFQLLSTGHDDTLHEPYVWVQSQGGPSVKYDVDLYKRDIGTGNWINLGQFDDGDVGTTQGINGGVLRDSAPRTAVFHEDGQTAFVVFSRLNLGPQMVLQSYWTTDGWATINTTAVRTHNTSVSAPTLPNCPQIQPIVVRGNVDTNRCWMFWIEHLIDEATTRAWIAHTDDFGQTWTVDGSPTDFLDYDWDADWDRAFMLDYADRLYVSVFTVDPNGTNPTHLYHTFLRRSTYGDTDWVVFDCDLGTAPYESSATCGDIVYTVSDDELTTTVYRIFNYTYPFTDPEGNPVADGVTTYNLLISTETIVPPPPPPPGPEDTTTRMFRRGVIQAEKRTFHDARRAPGSFHTWRKLPRGNFN